MALVINTNIASLNSQRQLNKSQSALGTSLQRLSSGTRINSAKDDAAGLAITERFTAQIRGLNQSVRNANDGISLAQTAEGALGEVTNNLQRIRELAVQSANATNSASDRQAMQQEVTQLINEVDRVASQSNFNGVNLLDGSFSNQTFQVGANNGETIQLDSLINATREGLGFTEGSVTTDVNFNGPVSISTGDVVINGVDLGTSTDYIEIKDRIDAIDGVSATSEYAHTGNFIASAGGDGTSSYTLTVEGVTVFSGTGAVTAADVDNALNSGSVLDDLTAAGITVTGSFADGDIRFAETDSDGIVVSQNYGGTAYGTNPEFDITASTATVDIESTVALEISGNDPSQYGLSSGTLALQGNTMDVSTVAGANAVITAVDTALDSVNSARANLGAVQNRFESVVTSLQTSSESLSAARSRIQDTDFAMETAALTRAQILQQAGTAMLSQANSLPQNVMSLLQ